MQYFLDTVETIESGVGFSSFGACHLIWLAAFVVITVVCSLIYKKSGEKARCVWRKVIASLLVADEIFKVTMLVIGDNYSLSYLPLHLCSINIILIAIHAFKPSKLFDNLLYMACIPGAIAALLFPTWTSLPVANFMHLHSFTVHILLALYPIMLTVGGDIYPQAKYIPKSLLTLAIMAVPIYFFNLFFDTNFMFLMSADEGNPLYWFGENWGSHLLGYPVLITAVLIVMYVPLGIYRKLKKD